MSYSIVVENDLAYLKKADKNLGFADLKLLDLNKEDLEILSKLKFNKVQLDSYDFSSRVRGYTKDNKKDKVYFYFETKKFEMYLSIKDGKLYNIFDQEVPLGKVSGNFRHVIPEDKYTGNLIKYLTDDVLGGSSVSPYENCST